MQVKRIKMQRKNFVFKLYVLLTCFTLSMTQRCDCGKKKSSILRVSKLLHVFQLGLNPIWGKLVLGWGLFATPPSKHPKSLWKTPFFCFSYINRKSHEIWGYFEAILRVIEPILGKGVLNTPPPQIGLKKTGFKILILFYIVNVYAYELMKIKFSNKLHQ